MYTLGVLLIMLGIIALVAAAIIFFITAIRGSGEIKGGGVFLIGPLPIIIGSDKELVKWAIILTIVAMLFFIVVIYLVG